jgi:hypothetical protein
MSRITDLKNRYRGLIEMRHERYKEGDVEGVSDILDAMESIEKQALPRPGRRRGPSRRRPRRLAVPILMMLPGCGCMRTRRPAGRTIPPAGWR